MLSVIKDAARHVGGVPVLATRLGVSRQALYGWRRVPADMVAPLARETGWPARRLRPDLFGDVPESATYEGDFAAWATSQSALLRAGAFASLDVAHLCEELDDLARRDKDEIESRLAVLLAHLLKMRHQPGGRGPSWDATVLEQRARIARRILRSPSLKGYPALVLEEEYALARRSAAIETSLPPETFPPTCPFTADEALDLDFVPAPVGFSDAL